MIDENIAPDVKVIKDHLTHVTRRWHELNQPCLIELVFLTAEDKARVRKVNHYTPDENGIDMAVDDCRTWGNMGVNAYATVNPVDANNRPAPDKRANASQIVASFFHWADADDGQAADNIRNFVGPKSTFYVLTGTTPTQRPHVYWELEEPTRNFDAWSKTQRSIAQTLKTDPAVVDPPRIMRIAGTVNWPKPQKKARGYVPEIVGLHIYSPDQRPPVTSENMARAFPGAIPADEDGFPLESQSVGKDVRQFEDILRRARTDGEKHTGVRDLAASLAGQGVNRSLAEAIIRQSCPVWDEGVEKLIETAYAKFYDPKEVKPVEPTQEVIADFPITPLSDFVAKLRPTEYLIDGILPRGMIYSLTGFPGHGKTTLGMQFAISVGAGTEFAGVETSQGSVVFLAGENPDNLRQQAAAAIAAHNGKAPAIHFVEGRFSLAQMTEVFKAKIAKIPDVKLIIIDSLQAFFEGDNDNDNSQMVEMAHKLRALNDIECAPAILVIAHPAGKKPDREGLVPRGGGSFLAEIDGNLTCWAQDGQQTLHHSDKFRGAPFEPIEFIMEAKEFDHIIDSKGRKLKTPVSRPELTLERMKRENTYNDNLKAYLDLVAQGRVPSEREAVKMFGLTRHKVREMIRDALDNKLIKPHAKTFKITDGGREYAGLFI